MSRSQVRFGAVLALVLGCGLPLAGSGVIHALSAYRTWAQQSIPFHAVVEALGMFAGLTLAALLLLRRSEAGFSHHVWTACGLIAMGVLDGFHAACLPGRLFVWFRGAATLLGGVCFALVWLPEAASRWQKAAWLPALTLLAAAALGACSLAWPQAVPAMLEGGRFTGAACTLNFAGGAAFLAASVWFLIRYQRAASTDDLLFASFSLLFGMAGVLFWASRIWSADWWWWHLLRLAAYLLVLGQTFLIYQRGQEELQALNESLEQKVAERAARVRAILDAAVDAIVTIDERGTIESINPAGERLFGYQACELAGQNVSRLMPSPHHEQHDGYLAKYLATGRERVIGRTVEVAGQHRDGTIIPIELSVSEVRLGERRLFMGIVRDISERKRAEEALAKEEERSRHLAAVVESSADAIISKDLEGIIRTWNKGAERLFGYSPEEMVGRPMAVLIPPERAGEEEEILGRLRRGERVEHFETVRLRKDGERIDVSATISPMRDATGRVTGASNVARDISERKRAEEALARYTDEVTESRDRIERQAAELIAQSEELARARSTAEAANRAKSQFLANMSHEIRTPFSGILGMTELALATDLSPEQREFLTMAKSSADALLSLLNDILDFSKIEAGRLELDPVPFALRDSVEDAIRTLAHRAHEKGLELVCHVAADVPDALEGDVGRLRQVLLNLASNAIKFTAKGEVVVRVEAESISRGEAVLRFSVSDTGIGIPRGKIETLFQPFSQADSSMTRKYGGTGLGLAIVRQLAGLMGGRAWAESAEGEGSTFHFTARFTLKQAEARQPAPPSVLRGMAVLVVDDNAVNRRLLTEVLGGWGMRATAAGGGAEALSLLERAQAAGGAFPLVLVDCMMPEMDGFELAEAIKSHPGLAGCTVMMLSSASAIGDKARCRELGVAAHLTKPIKQSELLATILATLGAPSLAAASLRPGAPAPAGPAARRPLLVLLAEDNQVNQRLAVRLLEKEGHAVVVACNGREAVAACRRQRFDLVLMDVQMPEMDGIEATAVLRAGEDEAGRKIPIVALTAHAMKGDRERCLAAGMDDYLPKPIQPADLRAMIEKVTGSSEP